MSSATCSILHLYIIIVNIIFFFKDAPPFSLFVILFTSLFLMLPFKKPTLWISIILQPSSSVAMRWGAHCGFPPGPWPSEFRPPSPCPGVRAQVPGPSRLFWGPPSSLSRFVFVSSPCPFPFAPLRSSVGWSVGRGVLVPFRFPLGARRGRGSWLVLPVGLWPPGAGAPVPLLVWGGFPFAHKKT